MLYEISTHKSMAVHSATKVTSVLLCSRLRYRGEAPAAGYKGHIRHNVAHKVRIFRGRD
jgi:hypothetical protein